MDVYQSAEAPHLSLIAPLGRAFEHMRRMLFEPFDLGKWFVIGFGCWLAELTSNGFGGLSSGGADLSDDSEGATLAGWDWDLSELSGASSWLVGCGVLGLFLVAFVLVLIVLLIWLSSRGHFIFLDNVVRDCAEIRVPWRRFATQGDSLFAWRLGFLVAAVLLVLLAIAPMLAVLFYLENRGSFAIGEVAAVVASVLPLAAVVVALIYTHLFLVHFVVPIMYREGLTTGAAWHRFLPLLQSHFGTFLVYGLFILLLAIGVFVGLMVVVLCTCCIAAIPLIIPYVGTVVLLPIYIVFRAYSLEFLAQLMPSVGLPPAAVAAEVDVPLAPRSDMAG